MPDKQYVDTVTLTDAASFQDFNDGFYRGIGLSGRGSIAMHATTMDLFAVTTSGILDGTGSAVTITAIVNATKAGARRVLYPITGTTITNGATFAVDGAANYTTAAGDALEFEAITTSTYKVHIIKKDGAPTVAIGSYIYGNTYANNATDPTNDIDITSGGSIDSTNVNWMIGTAIIKRLDAAFVVGTNQGGLDTGAVANADYYIWRIKRSDTGVVDVLFSLSATAPTMPANYDFRRLIGWFKRVAAANVLFTTYETEGGGLELLWSVPTMDINLANTLTTARRTDAVKVPLNFSVIAKLRVFWGDAIAGSVNIICCPDETDTAPSASVPPGLTVNHVSGIGLAWTGDVRTSSAGRVASRSTLATVDNYHVFTVGLSWSRR